MGKGRARKRREVGGGGLMVKGERRKEKGERCVWGSYHKGLRTKYKNGERILLYKQVVCILHTLPIRLGRNWKRRGG